MRKQVNSKMKRGTICFQSMLYESFYNHNLFDDIIKNSNEANMFTTGDPRVTPLSIASSNKEEDEMECFSAATLRRDKTVERLIQKGADVNLCKKNEDWCISPLFTACYNGHESTAHLLLKISAEVNFCTKDARSAYFGSLL